MNSDPAIRWQVMDSIINEKKDTVLKERQKIAIKGWGKYIIDQQDEAGTWANGLYNPKFKSTTYTMLLLRRFGILPGSEDLTRASELLLEKGMKEDGGINYNKSKSSTSETCITGMVLSILAYFRIDQSVNDQHIDQLISYLEKNQLKDGGWNCRLPRGATHSSMNTTLLVLEGLMEYENNMGRYKDRITEMQKKGQEFLLKHHLYKSHTTGKVIDYKFTKISFPPRWRYNILSTLDYFQHIGFKYDVRFEDSIELLISKEKNGKWPLQRTFRHDEWIDMETGRTPSRWNTLRALRVLNWWEKISK